MARKGGQAMKQWIATIMRWPWRLAAGLLLRFAITCALTAAQLGGQYAPWALAAVAVSGGGLPGLFALLGTACGSWLFLSFQPGLRHAAAATLIFAASLAFRDSKLSGHPLLRPAVCAVMPLIVHFPALLGHGAQQWLVCVAAAGTAAACAWWATVRGPQERTLLLFWGFSAALTPLAVSGFSPGRVCAGWLALLLGILYGPGNGAVLAAGAGAVLGLVSARPTAVMAAAFGFGALAAALGGRRSRLWSAVGFLASAGVVPILFDADNWDIFLYEMAVAALAYFCTPKRFLTPQTDQDPAADELVSPLRQGAAAFRELYDSFFRHEPAQKPENPSVLFDRAAEAVCRSCPLCPRCWQQEYTTTYNAFNDACPSLLRRGKALASDFPIHFSSRCVRFSELLGCINTELYAYLLRRQYRLRLGGMRELAAAQYAQMGELLGNTPDAVPAAATAADATCETDIALRPKDGQTLCGDQAAVFTVGDTVYLLLCDGMGSGSEAHAEAAMTVRLLRQFLSAGVAPLPALKTLNTAMRLRCDACGSFTTVDLLAVQKQSGEASLYKYGAAASYCKMGGRVKRLAGRSLPAGLQGPGDAPEITRITLPENGVLVLVSDGVTARGDEWLQDLLAGWEGGAVHLLTGRILSESDAHGGREDDCAVLAVRLKKTGKPKHV